MLQNILNKMTVVNVEEVRRLKFPERAKKASMQLFRLLSDNARPALSSCLGWGRGNTPDAGKGGETGARKRSRRKKKEKKCGEKFRKRG